MKNRNDREDEVQNALEILSNVLQEREQAVVEFEKGGQDVKFAQVRSIGSKPIEISKGVLVYVSEEVNQKYFILKCKMKDKAELNRHMHSDYGEAFDLFLGCLFDKESNRLIKDKVTFEAGEWHHLVAVGECEMEIHCKMI